MKTSESEDTIKISLEWLKYFKNSSLFTKKDEMKVHYRLSKAYEYEGDYSNAIKHSEPFIKLIQEDSNYSKSRILGFKKH